jgi:hypothetical protein
VNANLLLSPRYFERSHLAVAGMVLLVIAPDDSLTLAPFARARRKSDGCRSNATLGHGFAYWQCNSEALRLGLYALWRASNRSKTVTQCCSKTCFGELVRIAITQTDLEPVVANSLIQSSLEISVPHIDEMITS